MNINSSTSTPSSQSTRDRLGSRVDNSSSPSASNLQRSNAQSKIDRFAQNANDLRQIKTQVANSASGDNPSISSDSATQNIQSGVIGQNGILSKKVQGLPQPQNLPSTLSILKNRQDNQNPVGPGAYTFSKTYAEKTPSPNATALLGSNTAAKKNPPPPNPALSPPPPRGAQLQLYAPSLRAGNKALDIQDHAINAF